MEFEEGSLAEVREKMRNGHIILAARAKAAKDRYEAAREPGERSWTDLEHYERLQLLAREPREGQP